MVVNKRKKQSRYRGTNTHGWGRNQHRGAGTRGGRGNAGSGKKADQNKSKTWGTKKFGKKGFHKKNTVTINTINLKDVQEKIPAWIKNKTATEEGGVFVIDLGKLGYNKLLSTGKASQKLKITVQNAASRVQEKIKEAGGEVVVAK